jgi:hypothetical protein
MGQRSTSLTQSSGKRGAVADSYGQHEGGLPGVGEAADHLALAALARGAALSLSAAGPVVRSRRSIE